MAVSFSQNSFKNTGKLFTFTVIWIKKKIIKIHGMCGNIIFGQGISQLTSEHSEQVRYPVQHEKSSMYSVYCLKDWPYSTTKIDIIFLHYSSKL